MFETLEREKERATVSVKDRLACARRRKRTQKDLLALKFLRSSFIKKEKAMFEFGRGSLATPGS